MNKTLSKDLAYDLELGPKIDQQADAETTGLEKINQLDLMDA